MNKFSSWIDENILNIFLVFLLVLNILPILAPILSHLEIDAAARAIYTVYSFFCHQQHWKSLHIFDYQIAWCARDMFIWASMLVVATIVKYKKIPELKWYWLVIYALPIALDGGVQTIASIVGYGSNEAFYVSNNFIRMLTGSIFGSALGLFIFPTLKKIVLEEQTTTKSIDQPAQIQNSKWKLHLKIILATVTFMVVVYISLIQLWQATSDEYLPGNWLDNEVKLPESNREWFERRKHGI